MSVSRSSVTSSLWFIPVLCVLAGVVRSISTIAVDSMFGYELVPRWLTGGPDRIEPDANTPGVIEAPESAVLIGIDRPRLVQLATPPAAFSTSCPDSGATFPGAPLVRIEGASDGLDRDAVAAAMRSGLERTLDEDLGYGFGMLVDMAERALSESPFLDPTTAVRCIDRLHDGLRQLSVS